MDVEILASKIKTLSVTSKDIENLINAINQKSTEIDTTGITEDDIEYLRIFRLLLEKSETVQNNSIGIFEWREIGESAYFKLKNIISDMESLRIIGFMTEALGGTFHFRLVDKSKYINFVLDDFSPILKKIKPVKPVVKNKVILDIRKTIFLRIDPNLTVLESWLKFGTPKDFEAAVTLLLWLSGLSSVNVGAEFERATLQNRRKIFNKSSVNIDIIAEINSDNGILLCQCTIDWNNDKVTELGDIYIELNEYFKSKSCQVNIYPIIVTRIKESMIQRSVTYAKENGMYVFSLDTLLKLLDDIRQDNTTSIVNLLQY